MDPITVIAAVAGGMKSILEVWPKGDKKRLKMAAPFSDLVEQNLKTTVGMLSDKAERGDSMGPAEIQMLAFALAQAAGFADAVGDTIRGFDDDGEK